MERVSEAALKLAKEWAEDDSSFKGTIDRQLVHKETDENVLVSRLEQVTDGVENEFIAAYNVDPGHKFFFEHELDHVPGLLIIEASRQTAEAVSQAYLGVPADSNFILSELNADFMRFAELSEPLLAVVRVEDIVRRHSALARFAGVATVIQDGAPVAELRGAWRILDPQLYARMAESMR